MFDGIFKMYFMWTWKSSQTMSSDDDDCCIVDNPPQSRNNVSRPVVDLQGRSVPSFKGDTFRKPATISDGKVKQDPTEKFVISMIRIAFREELEEEGAWLVDGTPIKVDENDPKLVKAMKEFFDEGEKVRRPWAFGVELEQSVKDDFAVIVKGLYPEQFTGRITGSDTDEDDLQSPQQALNPSGGAAVKEHKKRSARGAAGGAGKKRKELVGVQDVLFLQEQCAVEARYVLDYYNKVWEMLRVSELMNQAPENLQPVQQMLSNERTKMIQIAGKRLQDARTRTCDKTLKEALCTATHRLYVQIRGSSAVCRDLFKAWNKTEPVEGFEEWHKKTRATMQANIEQDMKDYAESEH